MAYLILPESIGVRALAIDGVALELTPIPPSLAPLVAADALLGAVHVLPAVHRPVLVPHLLALPVLQPAI